MDVTQIKQIIKRELPTVMQEDTEIQKFVLQLVRNQFADKRETESRFDRVLDELRRDREANEEKWRTWQKDWEANEEKWKINEEKWAKNREANEEKWRTWQKDREANEEKWKINEEKWAKNQEANEEKWRTWQKNWEANEERWKINEEKWAKNQEVTNQLLKDMQKQSRRLDSSIGALGARWGIRSEQSFRNALKSILEESFAVEVLNITEFDDEGYVFGRPDQVELDIIIKNGMLIICEIKSSMSRSDMYTFGRKIAFYENRHNKKATRTLVISPMVDEYAKRVAKKLNIEIYSHADDVETI